MTAYPGKGGEILEYAVESALGTPGSYNAMRMEDGFDFPTSVKQLAKPSHMGRNHWGNTDDSPVVFENYQEGSLKIPSYVRAHGTPASKPPLVSMLESAGFGSVKTTSVNCDAYTSAVNFSGDAAGSNTAGTAAALQVDDGNHWPFISTTTPASSAYNFVPGYAVPGSISTPASNDIYGAYCLTPKARQVPTTATMAFKWYTRQLHSVNQMQWTATGCALSAAPKLTFETGKPIKLDMAFHVADVTLNDSTYTSADETAVEGEEFVIWGGATSQFAFANSNTSGGISAGTVNLIKADVDFAHRTVPIIGTGTTGTLNNCQGYMCVPGAAKITMDILCDVTYWSDIANSTFTQKYIHFASAGGTTRPFFMAAFPRCQQIENPQLVDKRGDYMQVRLTYLASVSNWGSDDDVDDDASAPWYIVTGIGVAA
jgi:hypothetical protein